MLEFRPIEITDRTEIGEYTAQSDYQSCEYAFTNLFIWRQHYHTSFAVQDGALFIRNYYNGMHYYFFPAGAGDKAAAIRKIMAHAADHPYRISLMSAQQKQVMESLFPGQFLYTPERDAYEYIYNAGDLIDLPGRKYHGKRNHISKFYREVGDSTLFEPITMENVVDCKNAYFKWLEGRDGDYHDERISVNEALNHFDELGLIGGLLRCPDGVCAFTAGRPLNSDTFVIHIEKGLDAADGVYSVINNLFAKYACAGYSYINREDDIGIEGLRKSKLSYHPAYLIERFSAKCATQE